MTKTCSHCTQTQPVECFSWSNRAKGLRQSRCKPCINAWKKAHRKDRGPQHYAKIRDKERARWQKRMSEQGEHMRARRRAWYHKNPSIQREHSRRWVEANSMHVQEYMRQYCQEHKAECAEKSRRRRALKLERKVSVFTAEDVTARMSVFGFRCAYCDGPFEEVDHVIPLSRGGLHCLANLRPACVSCNRRKWAKPASAWLSEVA